MADYWIKRTPDADAEGPMSGSIIRQLAVSGVIAADSLISLDRTTWHAADRVKGLLPGAAPSVPLSSPPPLPVPTLAPSLPPTPIAYASPRQDEDLLSGELRPETIVLKWLLRIAAAVLMGFGLFGLLYAQIVPNVNNPYSSNPPATAMLIGGAVLITAGTIMFVLGGFLSRGQHWVEPTTMALLALANASVHNVRNMRDEEGTMVARAFFFAAALLLMIACAWSWIASGWLRPKFVRQGTWSLQGTTAILLAFGFSGFVSMTIGMVHDIFETLASHDIRNIVNYMKYSGQWYVLYIALTVVSILLIRRVRFIPVVALLVLSVKAWWQIRGILREIEFHNKYPGSVPSFSLFGPQMLSSVLIFLLILAAAAGLVTAMFTGVYRDDDVRHDAFRRMNAIT